MKAIPAIDLRDGACVQLVGGELSAERVRIADPLEAMSRWKSAGFGSFHLVDLDAALGTGVNDAPVKRLLAAARNACSVGGGVKTEERIRELLELGAARVVVGTRALEEPAWLEAMARRFPERLMVAADVRDREVVTRGWKQQSGRNILEVLEALRPLPLGSVLVTAVHREGQMAGIDLELFREVVQASRAPVIASGGVTTLEDLSALSAIGVSGAVIGMALYTGTLNASAVAREFA